MKVPITIQSANVYALFIEEVTEALESILPQTSALILQCWEIVWLGIDPKRGLCHKILSEIPYLYDRFCYSLDKRIKSYFESPHPFSSSSNFLPSSPQSRGHNYNPNSAYQHRSHGNYSSGGTSSVIHANTSGAQLPSSPSLPHHQRTVANVAMTSSSSCENCGIPGHNTIECDREFCRACQQQDDSPSSFFHRLRDCVEFDFHERV